MKVGIITESFLPQVNGVTNSVLRILEFLAAEGHQALVIAPESNGGPDQYCGHRVIRIPALPVQTVIPIGMPIAMPSRKIQFILEGFGPDVLHLASPFALGAYGARVAKKLGVPALSIYQTDLAGFSKHYGFGLAQSSLRKVVAKIHGNTSRTLAPSIPACRELRESGVENVHLWRRGVNATLFDPSKRDELLRAGWGAGNGKKIIGFVGRLANEKRISDLRFLDRDPSVQLVITGEGPAREKLESEMPNAIFTGFKSGEDLAAIYASLDLFIHPGPNETFCQSVQEALASGTPAIVPTTGGPSDLVTHGATGYIINTHRPDELEAAVLHFSMRNDREKMRILARESVEYRTWNRINQQLLTHYTELCALNSANKVKEVVA